MTIERDTDPDEYGVSSFIAQGTTAIAVTPHHVVIYSGGDFLTIQADAPLRITREP